MSGRNDFKLYLAGFAAMVIIILFYFVPDYWLIWILFASVPFILIASHSYGRYEYECGSCHRRFPIGPLAALGAKHGKDDKGFFVIIKCPMCAVRTKAREHRLNEKKE